MTNMISIFIVALNYIIEDPYVSDFNRYLLRLVVSILLILLFYRVYYVFKKYIDIKLDVPIVLRP